MERGAHIRRTERDKNVNAKEGRFAFSRVQMCQRGSQQDGSNLATLCGCAPLRPYSCFGQPCCGWHGQRGRRQRLPKPLEKGSTRGERAQRRQRKQEEEETGEL